MVLACFLPILFSDPIKINRCHRKFRLHCVDHLVSFAAWMYSRPHIVVTSKRY
jgi:hypothetical protein